MGLLLLLALGLTGTSVVFAVRAVVFARLQRRETLAQIEAYGFAASGDSTAAAPRLRELVDRLAVAVGTVALGAAREGTERDLLSLLRRAGLYRTRVDAFAGYRVMLTAAGPLLVLWLSAAAGSIGVRTVLVALMLAGLGWVLPRFVVERRGTTRLRQIDLELPELVDLLVTTVEAGLGFASSLQLVVRRIEGPLGQELRLALREQSMGLTIEEALANMLGRADSAAMRAFVQAILQGQKLGVSIGRILRDLAIDMRKRRRQMAEERAQKAPTKLLFPLIVLILPALLIVALGGPLIAIAQTLSSAV